MTTTYLSDVNFRLALAFQRHAHHIAAARWMASAPPAICVFCRTTQQGFLRLATNPKVFGDETLTMDEAWTVYDQAFDDPRVAYAEEPDELEAVWRTYSHGQSFSPKVWNDAYLAAFARAAGFALVTFDRGFVQYVGTRCTILS